MMVFGKERDRILNVVRRARYNLKDGIHDGKKYYVRRIRYDEAGEEYIVIDKDACEKYIAELFHNRWNVWYQGMVPGHGILFTKYSL